MNRVHIPRGDSSTPGTWMLVDGQPLFRCPKCKVGALMTNHSVDADGTVNASIGCFSPCDYHEWGILDDWTYGRKEPGQKVKP